MVLQRGNGNKRYLVSALATRINTDNMYYRAHHGGTKCRKKVQEVSGHQGVFSCKCGATDIPTQETALRYMVRICLADCTDYEWAVMFEAESLFGKTAQELCDIREKSEEDFMQLVQSLQFTERLWTVAAKVETYQGENRVNTGIVLINSAVCGCGELIN